MASSLEEERRALLVDQLNVENKIGEITERIRRNAELKEAGLPRDPVAPEPSVMDALSGKR